VTTIVLADDHHVVRQGVRVLLEAQPAFSIVGEAADGHQAVRLVTSLRPAVLVVDLTMPGLTGLEVTRLVRQHAPETRIVILSMHANEEYVLDALRSGASAYVLKNASADELVRAIRKVLGGGRYLSPPLSARAIDVYSERCGAVSPDRYDTLTARERAVLQLAAEGCNHRTIATRLGMSPRTAEVHRVNLMRKLDLHNQMELIWYAMRRGVLSVEEE